MGAIFIASVFAAAYVYLIKSTDTSYRIHRMDGYRLYFYVASWAAIFGCLSTLIVFLIDAGDLPTRVFPELFDKQGSIAKVRGVNGNDAKAIAVSVVAILLSVVLCLANRFWYRFSAEARTKLSIELTKGHAFERLLFECSVEYDTVCINTNSDKVYVGLVQDIDLNRGKLDHIALLPILSGYRTSKRKKIKFTTNYYRHYKELESLIDNPVEWDAEIEKFRLVIPCNEIVALSKFDIDTYQKINGNQQNHVSFTAVP